ncbi:MAG: hypothetical protein EA391_06155 [Balneolaceae bacterium]|nr:MAG: hypothetical protein EA391_06155 [Balneolaceae bacterium]
MSENKNRSITYIYDEMDPSEKVEFERDLELDENLLIEVESLKRVQNRLNGIQTVEAPQHVVDNICLIAGNKSQKPAKILFFSSTIYSAAAALLLLGLTSSYFFLNGEESTINEGAINNASVSAPVFFHQPEPAVSIIGNQVERNVTPWVDTNEVIYFHDRLRSNGTATVDSIFENSFRKLTPVQNPSFSNPNRQNLHLTGSRR